MDETDKANQQGENTESEVHRHSKVITGFRTLDDKIHWRYTTRNLYPHEDESIEVRFFVLIKDTPAPLQGDAIKTLFKQMEHTKVAWLSASRKDWAFDLDRMKEEFEDLRGLDWCRGRVYIEPEFKVKKEDLDISGRKYYETFIVFYINPEVLSMAPTGNIPPEIQQSLRDFRLDHPDPRKVAFIMMKFGTTKAQNR